MDLNTLRELLTPSGQQALQAAANLQPREVDFLAHFTRLSRQYPSNLARVALETAILRREAAEKFPCAEGMYFTRPALEQATAYEVATYRAERLRGFTQLVDLGCSIGGDTLALAQVAPTLGIDLDPLRLALAQANLQALDESAAASFVQADLTRPLPVAADSRTALFFDPARRSGERRIFSVVDYQPPLGIVKDWLPAHPALGVKISPGVKLDELAGYPAEIEFISLKGDLKEALLWFGPLRTVERRATLLPGPYTLAGSPDSQAGRWRPLSQPLRYLYEPDPAVLRAGLVQLLGKQMGAAQLDPDIAYLTCDREVDTPFARCWQVEDWLPFQVKRLRAALQQRRVSRVVVKKRGSPIQPEEMIRALRLKGEPGIEAVERVLFLTHLNGQPVVIICLPQSVNTGR